MQALRMKEKTNAKCYNCTATKKELIRYSFDYGNFELKH